MHRVLDNTTAVGPNYADPTRREKGESRSSTQTHRGRADAHLESGINTSSILATAGAAAGGAFLIGSFAGPFGALGGTLVGIALSLFLQRSVKK